MIHTFIGEIALHTHENVALEDFLERLESRWGASTEAIAVIANSLWNGSEIDAVCVFPRAIVVIDFKTRGGRIQISENGPWKADDGVVKGGSKLNPFAQVRDNKRAVISWLEDRKFLPGCNLGHISGAVVFTQPVIVEGDLGSKIRSWFHVTDLDRCVQVLASIASPSIQIDTRQVDSILEALGVREYRPLRSRPRPVSVRGDQRSNGQKLALTEKQQEAFDVVRRFLSNPQRKSLSVLGMTHSGKTLLLAETLRELSKQGRQPVVLAPNARIARRLYIENGLDCKSIYSHLYDRSNERREQAAGPDGRKRQITLFPPKQCADPDDCVYLIDEAHLVGNDYFELEEGKRYGSGQLSEDLLAFCSPEISRRQLILFGDPFQLPRGRREGMPLFGDLQRARSLDATEVRLTEMFEVPSRAVPLANARSLAEAIQAGDSPR